MSARGALKRGYVVAVAAAVTVVLFTSLTPLALAQHENTLDQQDNTSALVGMDAVVKESARQTVPVIGRLVTQNAGAVSVLINGVVTKLNVDVGDRVQRGDVLATLSPNSLKWARELRSAEIKIAQADLNNAKAQANLNRQVLKRLEDLRKSSAFSPARFEDALQEVAKAESGAARAEADLLRARANYEIADINLASTQVKAPYEGVVTLVNTSVGAYLNTGQPVLTLIDDRHMEIEADVPANRVLGLQPGTKVSYTSGDNSQAFAVVRAQVPSENPLTRTRTVRFSPDADSLGYGVALNQTVSILIPSGPVRDVVTVHKDAVLNRSGTQVVYLALGGKAQRRTVKLGEAVGGRFIVLSGLKPGEQVVVRGNERLRPGQDIRANGQK